MDSDTLLGTLLLRADASVPIGTGHVMRCLALAQAWQDAGGTALFAAAEIPTTMRERLSTEGFGIADIGQVAGSAGDFRCTIALARERNSPWVVVDGYQFGSDYQQALKDAGFKILFIDDYGHAKHYSAHIVLNQNVYASAEMYDDKAAHTRLLLGSQYSLLRREFAKWIGWRREIAKVGRKILVTIGGSDPRNFTKVVVEGLRHLQDDNNDIEAVVVVGGGYPHFEDLTRVTSQPHFGKWLSLRRNASDMPQLMAWADIAVAGAGSTCWEACLLQLPMLLVDIADNQKAIARALHDRGAAIHLGSAQDVTDKQVAIEVMKLLSSEDTRERLSEKCGSLVDGKGAARVCSELMRS
jgi:UDP-2,4-diacetamido-2,4,6-trideoxy-beta-L-altropyranose hydrolase